MYLDRGLPGKTNLCLTSSASGGISWPHHLTQCSYHKHKHHAWVAMQGTETLCGILSEGKTKEVKKKRLQIYAAPPPTHTDWGPSFINAIILLGLHLLSLCLKIHWINSSAHSLLSTVKQFLVFFLSGPAKVLPGEASSSWNWFVLSDTSACSLSQIALPLPLSSLFFFPWMFRCMCDGFCNEDSLMWRRSRVTRVLSWARGKKCKAGKTTVSHFLPPNQFQPSRMDLSGFVQFNFYFPALFWFFRQHLVQV